jgi:broad specificity phosphatase PhoE
MRLSATLSIIVCATFLSKTFAYHPTNGLESGWPSTLASDKCSYKYQPRCTRLGVDQKNRRILLQNVGVITGGIWLNNPAEALDHSFTNFLSDLPQKSPNSVRLYLCRHGQTENNRLHITQGSRLNPPLNQNGILMAERLGQALSQAQQPLSLIYHSPLLRAKQTAQLAALQFSHPPRIQLLQELAEMDFGPAAEGQKEPRLNGLEIYRQWSAGYIDERPPDGESCREVFERCSSVLHAITKASFSKDGSGGYVAAVAHSAFIRMFLALVQGNLPLATAVATQNQANANINVLDVDMSATVERNAKSILFGGMLASQAPNDFALVIPKTNVLRTNEIRHLKGVPTT